jgi:chromosome segregation ATPase
MNLQLGGLFSKVSKKTVEKRIEYYKNQLIKDPYNPKLCLQLADLLVKIDQIPDAIGYYHTAANLLTQRHSPSRISGHLIQIYKKILSLSPDDQACENLATEYNRIGKNTKAYNLYLSVGEKFYVEGEYQKALRLYQSALVLVPNSIEAHTKCADIYRQLGQLEKSASEYEWLGDLSLKRDKHEEALSYYVKASERIPSNILIRAKMADIRQRLGKKDEAVADYLDLADYYLKKGDPFAALKYYDNCLGINPNLSQARQGKEIAEALCVQKSTQDQFSNKAARDVVRNNVVVPENRDLRLELSSVRSRQVMGSETEKPSSAGNSLDSFAPLTFSPDMGRGNNPAENPSSGIHTDQTVESEKIQSLIREKELLEEKLQDQFRAQEILKEKMEKILESKRRLQREFQEQASQVQEERNNLIDKSKRIVQSEVESIDDLKSLQARIKILEEKLSQTGQEKGEIQSKLSRQILELKEKEKKQKAELGQIIAEKKDLEERLKALEETHRTLLKSQSAREEEFKRVITRLHANQNALQEKVNTLLNEKTSTDEKLKRQGEELKAAAKTLKQKLEQVGNLKQQLEQRLKATALTETRAQEKLRAELTKLETEKHQFQNQLEEVLNSKSQVEAELTALRDELDNLKQAKVRFSLKFGELANKYTQRAKVLVRLDKEKKDLAQRLEEELAQKSHLSEQLEKYKEAEQQLQVEIWKKLEEEKTSRHATENSLKAALNKYQTEGEGLKKELETRKKREAELEAQLSELLSKQEKVDSLKSLLREQNKKEEILNQRLNAAQVQYERTIAQREEEKTQLMERIQQLQMEADQVQKISSQQLSQIKAELEEKAQKEKLLVNKLKQVLKAKTVVDGSFSEAARKKLVTYEKKIATLQVELEESEAANQQVLNQIQTLESKYQQELTCKQQEIEELKKLKELHPDLVSDGLAQRLEKKVEEIQSAHQELEAFLKETRILDDARNLQLKNGLEQVLAEINKLGGSFQERISSLEERNLQTENWLKEVLHPQNLRGFLGLESDPSGNLTDKGDHSWWQKGIRYGRMIVFFLLVVGMLSLIHRLYREVLFYRLNTVDITALQSESGVMQFSQTTSSQPSHKTSKKTTPKPETEVQPQILLYPPESRDKTGSQLLTLTIPQTQKDLESYLLPKKKGKGQKKNGSRSEQLVDKKDVKVYSIQKDSDIPSELIFQTPNPDSPESTVYPTSHRRQQLYQPFMWLNLFNRGYDSENYPVQTK